VQSVPQPFVSGALAQVPSVVHFVAPQTGSVLQESPAEQQTFPRQLLVTHPALPINLHEPPALALHVPVSAPAALSHEKSAKQSVLDEHSVWQSVLLRQA
jgi:hypothetical protein